MVKSVASVGAITVLVVLSSCSSSRPPESTSTSRPKTPRECLQAIANGIEQARTIRIRFHHENFHVYPKGVRFGPSGWEGTLLLGETGKLSFIADAGYGGPYRVISNGTELWEDTYVQYPGVQRRIENSTTIPELLNGIRQGLAFGTILGPIARREPAKPNCCGWPGRRLTRVPPDEVAHLVTEESALTYAIRTTYEDNAPKNYRVTLWYDPASFTIKKRSITLEPHADEPELTVTEIYDEFVLNAEIPDERFKIPPEPTDLEKARSGMVSIREALDRYLIDHHAYPTTIQGLGALLRKPVDQRADIRKGPYLKNPEGLRDPWGSPFNYRSPRSGINPDGYDLWSSGPDKTPQTTDDVRR